MSRWPALGFLAAVLFLGCSSGMACEQAIRMMTFNAWGAGANNGLGPEGIVEAIRAAGADVVALQEARAEGEVCEADDCPGAGASRAAEIAAELGFNFHEPPLDASLNWANATLSRYPITGTDPGGAGVYLDIEGRQVAVFNIHLTDYPYQPYQALGIPYGDAPFLDQGSELAAAASEARGSDIALLASHVNALEGQWTVIIAGDFNEPSHLDWTAAAAESGRHPLAVEFPSILTLERLGFIDTYRAMHPDELSHPGFTWTPAVSENDPEEHQDRIDYILVRGAGVELAGAWVVGESPEKADIVVQPWISDHRAVVSEIRLPDSPALTPCSESPTQSP